MFLQADKKLDLEFVARFNMSFLRVLRTVWYVRPQQIASRVSNYLVQMLEKPEKFYSQPVPEFCGSKWCTKQDFLPPTAQNNLPADIRNGRFSFLNGRQHIGWPPDWTCNDVPRLWLYNLHYFEYLWALDFTESKTLVLDWIENYPLRQKQVGWEPYPISLRLMNFCGFFFGRHRNKTESDTEFCGKLWQGIFLQTEWLIRHLETHLLGNHYFENATALAIAGSCFAGPTADKWLSTGISILQKEIPEQILADGMHFERSLMYHSRIIYLMETLLNIGNGELSDQVREPLGRMLLALRKVCHPDGHIALLNDSAFGIYNKPAELLAVSEQLLKESSTTATYPIGAWALPDAGYYGFRGTDGSYLICDAGPVGPDYITGHAHADMFSFELSLKGHRVIVDSGVYDYEISSTRQYCRSTKAHNTIEISGQDQCEMWAAFRVARRGRPHDVKWTPSEGGFQLSAWHDGYKRLKGSPVHYREFNWNKSGKLIIKDIITASKPQSVISRLHLHPNCKIDQIKASTAWVTYPEGNFRIIFSGNGRLSLEGSYYCPEFGVKIVNKALAFSSSCSKIETKFQIEAL